MSHLKRSSSDVVQWLSNVRINISAIFLALSSLLLPHDLTMAALGREKKNKEGVEPYLFISHWLNLNHMAVSTHKGVWEIECLTSPASVLHAGIKGVRAFL